MNSVVISGRLVRDPVVRAVGETHVVNMTLAINGRQWTDKDGNKQQDVAYVDVEAWDVAAEVIGRNLIKGDGVYVQGELRTDKWKDKDGNNRSKLLVRCNRWEFPIRNKPRSEDSVEELEVEEAEAVVDF